MAIPYSAGTSFDTPTCIQGWVEYPFAHVGNNTTKVYHHIMQMNGDNYTPLAFNDKMTAADGKPERSPFSNDSSAYWVEDRGLAPAGNNQVIFDRIFANIPLDYEEGGGIYSHTFPANGSSGTTKRATIKTGTGDFLTSNGRPEIRFTLTSANAENFNLGDKIKCDESSAGGTSLKFYGDSTLYTVKGFHVIYEKSVSGSNYTYKGYLENYRAVSSITSHSASSNFVIESPAMLSSSSVRTENSESILTYRFIKSDDITFEGLEPKFRVLIENTSTEKFTETDALSSSTWPSRSEYGGLAYAGGYLQAEPETPMRWLGNIWMIVGRKVKAQ